MATFIYFIEPTRPEMPDSPTEHEAALVGQHFFYLKDLHQRGIAKFVGRTLCAPFVGIGVFEVADEAEAKEVAASDPAVAGGVFRAKVQPFSVIFA